MREIRTMKVEGEKRACRILFCSTGLSFGGEQKLLGQILTNLDRGQFRPVVCSLRPFEYVEPIIRDLSGGIICLQVPGPYHILKAVTGLRRVIRERNVDLLHMGIFGSEFAGLLAAFVTRIPVVALLTTTYDLEARPVTSPAKKLARSWKWRAIYLVHAILARMVKVHYIALSEEIKKSAIKNLHLPAEKIAVIPLGPNTEEFDGMRLPRQKVTQLKNDLDLDGAYPVLVNVARLSPVKGQKEIIEAMPYILKRFPGAKLLLAGDGPLLEELTRLCNSLGLRKHIHLLGRRDDIAALLAASDIFVFGSYYEGLPGAVIEAMAAGKPVVAFDIPALREVVQDKLSGILVNGRDVAGFARAVVQLAEGHREAASMGKQARNIAGRRFDIKSNLKKLEEIYKVVLLPNR
jgi:glycosyltransferase involved in cell wall biosynthesis